ncbi:hypothetical protein [Ancylobacter vacuolatus]|uniref:Etoposide-induced protein 2.4 (EI24) n=1 Tax=Ancylobacter vacuolatus TaxID=223389 RepID=A0ABU0DE15_9HYPH|nr:hypothetical protein [Ancylobacter vacuolatus]MDQ0346586.1 hypothetical protein [Ancylobacter vacuolatus]
MNAMTPLKVANSPLPSRPVEMPRALPFLLNVLLASALGGSLAGLAGALAGAGTMFALLGFFFLAPRIARARLALLRAGSSLWALLRPLVGLVLLPPAALLAITASLLLFAWERTLGRLKLSGFPAPPSPRRRLIALRDLLLGLMAAENLPMTAVNALLLLVLGCIAIGIQVAFYAALAAVPVLICVLMMLAVDSSREPEDGPSEG